ncbi:hypothetical protein LEP1GSC058_2763 [Leptospira fainei serovar Hurstbridge str. BUT 6]|uniref:Uncharacterized protein n=1 Tax=Leptospira fainei serovar Hurstbridge str. BUT 6 TaxID=1193011 RepID=S3UY43_9LEPT|nr:hypothetical protein [Leptospira fainei]EPG74138.1 hypothetical protein LEP1GSC058_2763 [Leptospira fainei serovar Hurstbridge str. BUT 6]
MNDVKETEWSGAIAQLAVVITTYRHVGTTTDQIFLACESLWADWESFDPTGPDWLQGFEEAMDEGEMRYAADSFLKVRSLLKEKFDTITATFESGNDMVLGGLILELSDGVFSLLNGPEPAEKTAESVVIEGEKLLEILLESNDISFPADEDLSEVDLDLVSDAGDREILRELIGAFEAMAETTERTYGESLYLLLSRIFIVHWSFYRLRKEEIPPVT